ncbi:hypothetical protein [Sphingorhabdus sp. EL138]|uniref:hypothetical protein n=1 Tax=Sphingorhabdus sp. EL138 TaxID=2073156 RepID=UPI0025E3D600|nr:hypothetical protein [Sphingorhabdus sp. EL138]
MPTTTSSPLVALEVAVKEFGPCEGGYDKARVRILREISSNSAFAFELIGKPPPVAWAKGSEGNVREWFGELAEALSQDAPANELLEWLMDQETGPQVNFSQVREIWITKQPEGWIADSDLNPTWNETEALAWIATQDIYVVGLSKKKQHRGEVNQYIGMLAYISSNKCRMSDHEMAQKPKWQSCHCLGFSWDQLRRFSRSKSLNQENLSILNYDIEKGCVSYRDSDGKEAPLFLKKHVFQFYPIPDPTLPLAQEAVRLQHQMRTGAAGRPTKGKSLYLAEFRRRDKSDELNETLSEESRHLTEWFQIHYPMADQPTRKTIENTIRREFKAAKAPRLAPPK